MANWHVFKKSFETGKILTLSMTTSKKRWLIAFILIIMIVLFFEWLVNRNRVTQAQSKDSIQHGVDK